MNRKMIALLLACCIGFQPIIPAQAYSNQLIGHLIAFFMENKRLAVVTALLTLSLGRFVWHKIDVKRKADRVEKLLGFDRVTINQSYGIHGQELMLRTEKLTRILCFVDNDTGTIALEKEKQEAINLLSISAVKRECFSRQELSLQSELERSKIWKRSAYANYAQELLVGNKTVFVPSVRIGYESEIAEKKIIQDKLTLDKRKYVGLKVFCAELLTEKNLGIWLANTVQLNAPLRQISEQLTLEKSSKV
jgi:hypothetical protein